MPSNAPASIPLLRFIPFRKKDILDMCLAEGKLSQEQQQQFKLQSDRIQKHFHHVFHPIQEQLKDLYALHDPDADTRLINLNTDQHSQTEQQPHMGIEQEDKTLAELLASLLNSANYEIIDRDSLQQALESESMFKIRLSVDLEAFEEVLLYSRGITEREETVSYCFGLFKKQLKFVNYDRVVLYIRFKPSDDINDLPSDSPRPGSVMLKLFQNVPQADIEMLFPNTQVGMRLMDKLLIGIPAIVSGGIVLTTKLGATLVLLGSLLGYWLGTHDQEVQLDKSALIALGAGLGAVAGYLWKQFSSYKNRKLRFTQALTQNLYFKLLDNNAGVFYRLINDAEESECKEAMLAYYFLLSNEQPISSNELDNQIEQWFAEKWQCHIDFEIEDALKKLSNLSLATQIDGLWSHT